MNWLRKLFGACTGQRSWRHSWIVVHEEVTNFEVLHCRICTACGAFGIKKVLG